MAHRSLWTRSHSTSAKWPVSLGVTMNERPGGRSFAFPRRGRSLAGDIAFGPRSRGAPQSQTFK